MGEGVVKRICTICVRGGSKGLPGKNMRPLLGKPLLAWTVEQAKRSGLFDCIAVSSDSPELLAIGRQAGADETIDRPAELASDTAGKLPAIVHAVTAVETRRGTRFDMIVEMDATAPLRLNADITGAVALAEAHAPANVITGSPAHRSPYFNLVERAGDGHVRLVRPGAFLRRQDAPACFDMNASIYVWPRDRFMAEPKVFYDDTLLFEMPTERSHDIDSALDFEIVELLMRRLTAG